MPLIWLDTNVARSVDDLRQLSLLAKAKQVTVVIHPQLYLERRRQMQADCVSRGRLFSADLFDSFLEAQGFQFREILLSRAKVATWADSLFRRYPLHGEWEAAKKATLGGTLKQGFAVEPGQMPMTTDWLIALEVEHDSESFVITEDQGEEWSTLRKENPQRALSWKEAIGWLQGLPL